MVLVSDKPMNSLVLTGLIVMVMHFLHTGRKRHPLPGTEEPMITLDFITALFYEIELIHPIREGRSPQQIGRKGVSNHRWIVGGKLCLLLNQWGLIVGWDCDTANVADNTFQWLIQQVDGRMIVLSDTGFHAAEGDPSNLKLCQRGEWEDRILVETVLSMLTLVCHVKKVMHRGWAYFHARLTFTMAAFNVLVQWHGLQPTASGFVPLSIAEFSL